MIQLILAVLGVILGSATCSASEVALLSVSIIKVRQLASTNKRSAKVLLAIKEKINRPIATIVVINNIFNIVGSIIVGSIATKVLGDRWLGVFSGILTFLIIIFGEIIPKTLGERNAEKLSLFIAIPLTQITFLLTPVVWAIEKATAPIIKGKRGPTTNEAEIQLLTRIGRQEGIIEDDEAEMIQRVFRLNDMNAVNLMTPRTAITYLRGDLALSQAQDKIISSPHTRIIVIGESIDDIIGFALKDDLLIAIIEGKGDRQIADLNRQVRFVPETIRADKLLQGFLANREHLVVVLDEFGGVSGIVTLEDVLEVVTGEIVDETDLIIDLQEIARRRGKRMLRK